MDGNKLNNKIRFEYEGITYECGMGSYDKNLPILLPCGRIVQVQRWMETYPPKPANIVPLGRFDGSPDDNVMYFCFATVKV